MRGSHRHPQGSESQTKQKIRLNNSPPGRKSVSRVSGAGSHAEFVSLQPQRGGSGDAVRSEMKTRLNDVVKVWVSIA